MAAIVWFQIKFNLLDEYIKQVSGCVATHPVSVVDGLTFYSVVSLTICTNFKSHGPSHVGYLTLFQRKKFPNV